MKLNNEKNLEISKMLTISTSHVTEDAITELDKMVTTGHPYVTYEKGEYGYFIHVGNNNPMDMEMPLATSLMNVLEFAFKQGVEWLCLDRDAEEVDCLTVYDWNEINEKSVMYGFKISASVEELVNYAKEHKEKIGYCGYSFKEITKMIEADRDPEKGIECPDTGIHSKYSIVAKILNNLYGISVYCLFHGNDCFIEAVDKEVLLYAANVFHSTVQKITTEYSVSNYKLIKKGTSFGSYFFGICNVERRKTEDKSEFCFVSLGGKKSVWFKESEYDYQKVNSVMI